MDVKEERILGTAIHDHWYYESKGRALLDFLDGTTADILLDVGAGSGVFTKQLLDAGLANSGICVDPEYDSEHQVMHNGKAVNFVHFIDAGSYNLVLMMDVLEHVEDDLGLLTEYVSKMPTGGRVLITVPAFQFLWSGHDVFLEHYRRYTLREAEQLIERAGLRLVKGKYFFGLLFPIITILRLWDRLKRSLSKHPKAESHLKSAHPAVNSVLIKAHDIERTMLFPHNRLAGLSVFCLAEKL